MRQMNWGEEDRTHPHRMHDAGAVPEKTIHQAPEEEFLRKGSNQNCAQPGPGPRGEDELRQHKPVPHNTECRRQNDGNQQTSDNSFAGSRAQAYAIEHGRTFNASIHGCGAEFGTLVTGGQAFRCAAVFENWQLAVMLHGLCGDRRRERQTEQAREFLSLDNAWIGHATRGLLRAVNWTWRCGFTPGVQPMPCSARARVGPGTVAQAQAASPLNGELRKALLAQALLRRRRLLILDDVNAGLDVGTRRKLKKFIESLRAGPMRVLILTSRPDEIPFGTTTCCSWIGTES